MRIAVIHHRARGDRVADLNALVASAQEACAAGAMAVVLPHVPVLEKLPEAERAELIQRIEGCEEGAAVYVSFAEAAESEPRVVDTPLGHTALLSGDACFRASTLGSLAAERVDTMIWRPRAESALQAEAIIEYALACAPALAGVLLVAECAGTAGGGVAAGTSAVIHAGEIIAEADGEDDELLIVDLDVPQGAPEPSLPLPDLPLILEQRLAVHEGRRPEVEYPADLS